MAEKPKKGQITDKGAMLLDAMFDWAIQQPGVLEGAAQRIKNGEPDRMVEVKFTVVHKPPRPKKIPKE